MQPLGVHPLAITEDELDAYLEALPRSERKKLLAAGLPDHGYPVPFQYLTPQPFQYLTPFPIQQTTPTHAPLAVPVVIPPWGPGRIRSPLGPMLWRLARYIYRRLCTLSTAR